MPFEERRDSTGGLDRLAVEGVSLLDRYRTELVGTALLEAISRAKFEFERTVTGHTPRGDPYGFGGFRSETTIRLYGVVRELRPSVAVETGVCNGESTAIILGALARNGHGVLHSIDHPEVADATEPRRGFWEGKKGAVIPKGKQPGWIVPEELRGSWTLTIGRSQDTLEPLLSALGTIDFFLHDSEHSEECMRFEYQIAWKHLRSGGVLVSDDIGWNEAFVEFSRQVGREMVLLDRNAALLIK